MKNYFYILVFVLLANAANAQFIWNTVGAPTRFARALGIPVRDTAGVSGIADSAQIILRPQDSTIYYRYKGYWIAVGGGKFKNNVIMNGPPNNRIGYYVNGDTIPIAGKTLDEAFLIMSQKGFAPTYYQPTVGVGSSPGSGSYERGTNIGTITLSNSFTQNDAGAVGASTYSKYISSWNNLGSNTDAITSLTGDIYYRVTTSYAQGACKNNNLGVQDCTGRVTAGSVTSSSILFSPFDKRYWGWSNSNAPSNATILALTQDNSGGTGALTLSNTTPTGSQFLVYFTKGSVTTVTVNGIPATAAFTITTYTVINAVGFSQTYSYIYSNNAQTSTLNSVIFN